MAEIVGSYGVDSFFSDLVHCDKRISKGFALVLFHLLALVGVLVFQPRVAHSPHTSPPMNPNNWTQYFHYLRENTACVQP